MEGVGVFGKHPCFGDFISQGVPQTIRDPLQTWLSEAFAAARKGHPETWTQTLADARPVRFWLGPAVLGGCVCGVMLPSHDKVGRTYPLLGLQGDPLAVPPPLAPDQQPYERLEAHLRDLLEREIGTAASLGSGAGLTCPLDAGQDVLWAVNPDAAPIDLLQAIGTADYTRSTRARSYWWCAPDDVTSGAVWSCSGLPEADALVWLMSGVARGAEATTNHDEAKNVQAVTGDDRS